jgi:hypothetical protein
VEEDTPANRTMFRKEPKGIEMPVLADEESQPSLTEPCIKIARPETNTAIEVEV